MAHTRVHLNVPIAPETLQDAILTTIFWNDSPVIEKRWHAGESPRRLKIDFLYETEYQDGEQSVVTTDQFNAQVRASFYRYVATHSFELCDHYNHESGKCPQILETFNAGFFRGAQFATKTTSELSPYIARFTEFMMWLTDDRESADQFGLFDGADQRADTA
jgi:hypothetical protein